LAVTITSSACSDGGYPSRSGGEGRAGRKKRPFDTSGVQGPKLDSRDDHRAAAGAYVVKYVGEQGVRTG
jgi:hypothetical protein